MYKCNILFNKTSLTIFRHNHALFYVSPDLRHENTYRNMKTEYNVYILKLQKYRFYYNYIIL